MILRISLVVAKNPPTKMAKSELCAALPRAVTPDVVTFALIPGGVTLPVFALLTDATQEQINIDEYPGLWSKYFLA